MYRYNSWTHCEDVGGARMQIVFIACGWSSGDISANINSVKVRRLAPENVATVTS